MAKLLRSLPLRSLSNLAYLRVFDDGILFVRMGPSNRV